MSTRHSIFKLDLPCFASDLLCFDSLLLGSFSVGPSAFDSFLLVFYESDLLYFESIPPIYLVSLSPIWVSPSGFSVSPSHFKSLSFLILKVWLFQWMIPIFWLWPTSLTSQSFPRFRLVLPIFFTASFLLLPVLRSDLIAMYTVDKIKDGSVCRKHLLHYHAQKIEIVWPGKLIKIILRGKQERKKYKIKWN